MLLSTLVKSYPDNSSRYPYISSVSQSLGLGSEVYCPRTLPWKTQSIQSGLNQEPLDDESNFHWPTQEPCVCSLIDGREHIDKKSTFLGQEQHLYEISGSYVKLFLN